MVGKDEENQSLNDVNRKINVGRAVFVKPEKIVTKRNIIVGERIEVLKKKVVYFDVVVV